MSRIILTDAQGQALRYLDVEQGITPGRWVFSRKLRSLPQGAKRAMAVLTAAGLIERFGSSARISEAAGPAYECWKRRVWAEGDLIVNKELS